MTTQRVGATGCPVITVDQARSSVPGGVPFLVKIDIEGFESDLFEDNLGWIDEAAAIFLEPHDWRFAGQGTSRAFQRAMGMRAFEVHVRGENLLYVNSRWLA